MDALEEGVVNRADLDCAIFAFGYDRAYVFPTDDYFPDEVRDGTRPLSRLALWRGIQQAIIVGERSGRVLWPSEDEHQDDIVVREMIERLGVQVDVVE